MCSMCGSHAKYRTEFRWQLSTIVAHLSFMWHNGHETLKLRSLSHKVSLAWYPTMQERTSDSKYSYELAIGQNMYYTKMFIRGLDNIWKGVGGLVLISCSLGAWSSLNSTWRLSATKYSLFVKHNLCLVLMVICIEEGGKFSLGLDDVAHLGQVDVQLPVVVWSLHILSLYQTLKTVLQFTIQVWMLMMIATSILFLMMRGLGWNLLFNCSTTCVSKILKLMSLVFNNTKYHSSF